LLQIEGIRKEFSGGAGPVVALTGVDLAIERGEFVTLVGPSGCGKSSLLTLISGLSAPSSGHIRINGREIGGTDRDVGFITQQDNLFPWRTLIENVALSLELAGVSGVERRREAARWIRRVGLDGF
jgi:NitT/TauT family transport system ATP-binding protein